MTHQSIKADKWDALVVWHQSIKADKWDALVAWLQKTKNEEDTDIYEFLGECLGVNASGEDTSIYDDEDNCPHCGTDRGDHEISDRNRLIPCESDGEGQYKVVCGDEDCDRVLDIDCPIMCWNDEETEQTLCTECWETKGYWLTDTNEDNEDEIAQMKE
jgi:hypothetical protein